MFQHRSYLINMIVQKIFVSNEEYKTPKDKIGV